MAMISDSQLAMVQNHVARQEATISKLKSAKARESAAKTALQVVEAAGTAGAVGFIRGKVEKSGKAFALGPIDGELLVAAALIGAGAVPKVFGKYGEHFVNAGVGVLSHYAGQMGRAAGKGGVGSIKGSVIGMNSTYVGMLPEYVGHGGVGDLASALAASAAG
jgi:hypothetical protein